MANEENDEYQRIFPWLAYRDCPEALRFLCEAFGFEERTRMQMPDGRVGYAELALEDNVIMVATAWEESGWLSPLDLGGTPTMLMCYVDDVDAHYLRAKDAGATVIAAPVEQAYGARSYRAIDPEGHRWIFATHIEGEDSE
jgi:PhnB protein